MTEHHINELATRTQPRQAAVGQLENDATPDDLTSALQAAGIAADRIYSLVGLQGAEVLENGRGFLSVFDDVIDKPLTALRAGHTLVGVFGVDSDDADAVRQCLLANNVSNTHYFGKWTYS